MNDTQFISGFSFREMNLFGTNHRDNSKGVPMHYLGYMKKGKGLLVLENGRLELNEGELFYIPKGCRYHSYWIGEPEVSLDSLGFTWLPEEGEKRYKPQRLACTPALWEVYAPLSLEKTVHATSIGRLYTVMGMVLPGMEQQPVSRGDGMVSRAAEIMTADPDMGIGAVAQLCGVSQATLYTNFKKVLGKTPNALRQELRCKQAMALLRDTDLSVEEVSRRAGFSSASYFRKILFAQTGKTPRQIRKAASSV